MENIKVRYPWNVLIVVDSDEEKENNNKIKPYTKEENILRRKYFNLERTISRLKKVMDMFMLLTKKLFIALDTKSIDEENK